MAAETVIDYEAAIRRIALANDLGRDEHRATLIGAADALATLRQKVEDLRRNRPPSNGITGVSGAPGHEARIKCVMMQRDEGETLDRWLRHYVALFGPANLTVFDNGSTDPLTLDLLHQAQDQGVDLRMGFDRIEDFEFKHKHCQNVIRSWDHEGGYDFALPVDCDEILAVFTNSGLTTDREAIHAELHSLLKRQEVLRIDMSLFNVPGRDGWFAPDQQFVKSFLPARSIAELGQGFHEARSRLAPGYHTTALTYLHFHNKSLKTARASARRKLSLRLDLDNPAAVVEYFREGRPGSHLIPLLDMSEEAYNIRYDQQVTIRVPATSDTQNSLRVPRPDSEPLYLDWFSEPYLHANRDVARVYALPALHHYLRHGCKEGRDPKGC